MFSRKYIGGGAVGAAILAAAVCQASASTLTDGDFNAPPGSAPFQTIFAGNTLGAWTVETGSVDFINGYWQSPPTGGNSVDMDGDSPGSISQTFTSAAGNDVLSFWLSGNPDGQPTTKTLLVTIATSSQMYTYTLGPSNTEGNMLWALKTLDFVGGGMTTLTFASQDNLTDPGSPYGPAVGGVSITPLPAALPLFAGGLGLIGFITRRRKRNGAAASSRLELAV